MRIELRDTKHAVVTFNPQRGDPREVIFDEEHKDLRICDGQTIVKVRFEKDRIKDILVNDVFVYPQKP